MIDMQTIPTGFATRPKRKYTVTDRVLAACRANLERANAVPREIRFRSTEKRRHACHHNLTLALIAKKRDRSPRYATCFRNGWYVADPERALGLVGATPEEYHDHLEAWRREIAPRDAEEEKLAHAIGMLSWRWIAGVRLECDLETLKIYRLLDELAAERRPGGPGTEPLPVTANQLTYLGYAVDQVLSGCVKLEAPLGRISGRMLRLWQELLRGRGEPLLDLKDVSCPGHLNLVAVGHALHSAFELAEPFQSCRETGAAVCPEPKPLLEVEEWTGPQAAVSDQSSVTSVASVASPQPGPAADEPEVQSLDGMPSAPAGAFVPPAPSTDDHAGFLHEVRPSDLAMLREARRLGWSLPGDFDGFLRLVQAAIGGPGSAGIPPAPPSGGGDEPGEAWAARAWARRVRLFARAVWNSLRDLGRHADDLQAFLNRRLGAHASSLWPEAWHRSDHAVGRSAHRLVMVLMGGPLEGQMQCRSEELADFYFELRMKLGRRMFGRWERCRAAVAVLGRVDSPQLTVDS